MIQLYHGEGKGKTTAAIGSAVRAAGAGKKVVFAQFMKGSPTSELSILSKTREIQVLRSPKDFGFYKDMTGEKREEFIRIQNFIAKEALSMLKNRQTDFVVLDEITHACRLQVIPAELVKEILRYGKENMAEVVLTGRQPPEFFREYSDYISEIRCERHPYEKGIAARKGVEF